MRLVIAEKPSVAQSIAAVLGAKSRHDGYLEGGGYIVSWCFGHLAELADAAVYNADDAKWTLAALPIIPTSFRFIVRSEKQKQFDILRELMRREDVAEVVNACDAGREGELIFRTVYCLAGCSKPILRLWISSMEDDAIRSGFQQLKSGRDYNGLHQSALCRAKADWLVGINATRYFSLTYGRTLNIGRVMSPTLALLVQREAEISAFVAEPFCTVQLDCGFPATTDRMKDRKDADAIANACKGKTVTVKSVERKEKSEKAPALYDLTSLQRDANRVLGYTSQQTLDYLQALYEKKLCTYPRTDSRYLTDDMEGSVPGLVAAAAAVCGMEKPPTICAKQVCSSKKVTDHHAIVPTISAEKVDIASLPLGEREVLKLAARGLLRAVDEPHRYAETVITVDCAGQSFTAKGKTVLAPGWKRYEQEQTEAAPALPVVTDKQKFISQIMTSKSPVRSCEDVDATALSFAEIKALCAGDPRIKERMDLDIEVSKLKIMKADHNSKQFRLEDSLLKYFPEKIEEHKGFVRGLEADMQTLAAHPLPAEGFVGMEIRGDRLTDKENAGAALLDTCKEVKGKDPVQIGSYRGFTMSVAFDSMWKTYTLTLKGQMTHRVELGSDARGNLVRIENALDKMPERLRSVQEQLENLYNQQAAAKAEVGKPFPQEQELAAKTARLIELDMELNLDGKGQPQPEQAIAKSARPSVLDRLKASPVHGAPEKPHKKEMEAR